MLIKYFTFNILGWIIDTQIKTYFQMISEEYIKNMFNPFLRQCMKMSHPINAEKTSCLQIVSFKNT